MAADDLTDDFDAESELDAAPRWGWGRWLFSLVAGGLLLLLAALPAAIWWLGDTASGRAFLASQLGRYTFASGLRYEVGRLDGSLFSDFEVVNLRVHDLDGMLAVVPLAEVSWHPAALLRKQVDIERLGVPDVELLRRPHINPSPPDEPLLPNVDIRIGRFDVARLRLAEPVAGRASVLALGGRVDIRSGRLLVDTDAQSDAGDTLKLLIDAEPDGDRFALDGHVQAPADGVLAPLAGLSAPLAIDASGKGSWTRWRGALNARLGAGKSAHMLAALTLTADGGRFRLRGDLQPEPLLPEAAQALLAPGVKLDVAADRANGDSAPLALRFVASTDALSMTGHAQLDGKLARIDDGRLDLSVRKVKALGPQLVGDDLRARLNASGPLRAPAIEWQLSAGGLGYASADQRIGVRGLQSSGTLRLPSAEAPLQADFRATASDFPGLPAEAAALLRQPVLSGSISNTAGGIDLGKLVLKTAALSATASARLDDKGEWRGHAQATVARYALAGMGAATASAAADFRSNAKGVQLSGNFQGRALQLQAGALRDFLGGLPTAAGSFAFASGQPLRLAGLRFDSPALRLGNATASYDPDSGQLAFAGAGRSRDYGAFTLSAAGTPATLQATLKAPAPGLGVGMTNLVAKLTPVAGGWHVQADAASEQGPLLLRAGVRMADAAAGTPLSLDIIRLRALGLSGRGQLTQTADGPFAGRLTLGGRGIDGSIDLASRGGVQQALLAAQLRNARLPFAVPVGVASGTVQGSLLLERDAPMLAARLQLRGVTRGSLVLASANGDAEFRGGAGHANVALAGHAADGLPFEARARLRSIADGYGLALGGTIGGERWHLEKPAVLRRTHGPGAAAGWELRPVRLLLPKGAIQLAGRSGARSELQVAFADIDLSILDLLHGDMGFGGRLNGQLRLAIDDRTVLPDARLDLKVSGLQRASVTGLTAPVDIAVTGASGNDGVRLGARITWQRNELGRLVAVVRPGSGAGMAEHLLNGALAGGVRYNGPVEPLWALVGSEGQSLTGAIALGADFAGTVGDPVLNGQTRGHGLVYRNAMFGTEIRAIDFAGTFSGSELKLDRMSAAANGGSITGSGSLHFGANASVDLQANLNKARVANSDTISVTLSGPLRLRGRGVRGQLTGDLKVDDARFQVVQMSQSEVPALKVRRQGVFVAAPGQSGLSAESLHFNVQVHADDRVRVEGMGLDSIWRADLRLRGTAGNPQLTGSATLARGDFSFAGSDFNLTSGRIVFNGAPLDSAIDLRAETQAQDVVAIVTVAGTAGRPEVHFSSTPTLPEDEILARLLFGSSVADLSVTEAVQLATAVAGLRSGTDTLGKIRRSVGLDRLRLVGNNSETGMRSGLAVGKKLTRNLYAELLTDSEGNTLTTLQLTLSRIWSVFLDVSSVGASSVNLRYQREN